jgi:hypothetical protein
VPADTSGIFRASVSIKRSLAGRIKSFVYKDEAVFVYYKLENGDIRMYRIVPKTASYGLWINPLIMNPDKKRKEPAVKKIMFRCSNSSMMKADVGIKWNLVSFFQKNSKPESKTESAGIAGSFFGVLSKNFQKELLVSENDLESVSRYWSSPDAGNISVQGQNHSFLLPPGGYSVGFEYPLDSLPAADSMNEFIIRTGVWAKASPTAKSVFVISIEKEGKSLIWKAVDINNFILDPKLMNYVTNFQVLDREVLRQRGLTLKVYAWNTGKEPFELDNFSVRIETN